MTVYNHRIADVHITQAIVNFNQEAESFIQTWRETPDETEAQRVERQESNRIRIQPAVEVWNSSRANPVTQDGQGGWRLAEGEAERLSALAQTVRDHAHLNIGRYPSEGSRTRAFLNSFLVHANA